MGSVELSATADGKITSVAYSKDTELPPMALVGVNDALADVPVDATWENKSEYKFTHVLSADEIKSADTLIEILRWIAARLDAGAGSMNPETEERAGEEYDEFPRKEAERKAKEKAEEERRIAALKAAEEYAYGDDARPSGEGLVVEQTGADEELYDDEEAPAAGTGQAVSSDGTSPAGAVAPAGATAPAGAVAPAGAAGGAAGGGAEPGAEGYIHGALTELWRSQEALIKDWSKDPEGLEEQWAQLFCELFSGINYDGTGEGYVMGDTAPRYWDEYIYTRLQSQMLRSASHRHPQKGAVVVGCSVESWENPVLNIVSKGEYDARTYEENTDPASPMCCACQYLATYGLITRGFRIDLRAKQLRSMQEIVGLSAAPAVGVPVFTAPGGAWVWRDDLPFIRNVASLTNPKPKEAPAAEAPAGDKAAPAGDKGAPAGNNPAAEGEKTAPKQEKKMLPAPPAITPGTVFTYHTYHQLVNHPIEFEVVPGKDATARLQEELKKSAGGTLKGAQSVAESVKKQEQAKLDAAIAAGTLPKGTTLIKVKVGLTGQPGGSHIMHVLRIHPSGKKVQLFDANGGNDSRGAMDREKRGQALDPGIGVNMDTAANSMIPGINTPNGIGVPKPAPDLPGQIAIMRKARPIGLARLVLAERKPVAELFPEDVLFVSRLMRTYGDAEHQNYTITRYLWALRNTPGFSSIQPFVLLFLPRGILARAMWASGSRNATLEDFRAAHEGICAAWVEQRKTKLREEIRKMKAAKPWIPAVDVMLPLDWRDMGEDGGYEITTNYRDAQILTNLSEGDEAGRSRIARNVVSQPDFKTGGATLKQGGMPLPPAFTKALPGVEAPRNIILPPETTDKKGVTHREKGRILAWDFVYVRADIDGADRLRALDEAGLEYFKNG